MSLSRLMRHERHGHVGIDADSVLLAELKARSQRNVGIHYGKIGGTDDELVGDLVVGNDHLDLIRFSSADFVAVELGAAAALGQTGDDAKLVLGWKAFQLAKHFTRSITDTSFTYVRDEESIGEAAALDGLDVLRTNVDEEQLDTAGVVLAYKSLAHVEQAFRHFKLSDLEVRPIYHYTEPRVRAHLLLCMLAYWIQREMQRALAPLLFVDEAPPARPDPVAPAPSLSEVLEKYRTQRTADGFPVHSFPTLLADLGTMVKNRVILTGVPEAPGFD